MAVRLNKKTVCLTDRSLHSWNSNLHCNSVQNSARLSATPVLSELDFHLAAAKTIKIILSRNGAGVWKEKNRVSV